MIKLDNSISETSKLMSMKIFMTLEPVPKKQTNRQESKTIKSIAIILSLNSLKVNCHTLSVPLMFSLVYAEKLFPNIFFYKFVVFAVHITFPVQIRILKDVLLCC